MTHHAKQAPRAASNSNWNPTVKAIQITTDVLQETLIEGGGAVLLGCCKDASQYAFSEYGAMTPRALLTMARMLIVRAREIETDRTWGWQFDPKAPVPLLPWRLDELEKQLERIFREEFDAPTEPEAAA
jgi:hypothetical protein